MSTTSFDRLLKPSRLASLAIGRDDFRPDRSMRFVRPDREQLDGKVNQSGGSSGGGAGGLSRLIDKRTPLRRRFGAGVSGKDFGLGAAMDFDRRQRAVVKVHYFNHAGSGAAALKAHARYVARDAATRDDLRGDESDERRGERDAEQRARAHAAYLTRDGEVQRSVFYDARADGVDGAARAAAWANSDKRHFRVVLSPEHGARLRDLPAYTREVMARAEAALGTRLQWIAVDHHDTDNPHTHIVIRGRRANGQDLILPKSFVKHGLRDIARDVATEWLAPRTPADERLALQNEIARHAPTRLDRMIEAQLPADRTLRIARLASPTGDPNATCALKARARELERMGLAREVRRNVLAFEPDWQGRLKAMELHLDIRRRVVQERTLQRQILHELSLKGLARGLLGR